MLAPGTYTLSKGQFEASSSGTAQAPITLTGPKSAVLTTGKTSNGGYGLHVSGSHWVLQGFSVSEAKKGIVLDGSVGTVVDAVDVGNIGQEGIHFRSNSTGGVVRNSNVHDTGVSTLAYGEGIYVGSAVSNWATYTAGEPDRSDGIVIIGNRITNTAAEGIDVKEGTSGGQILDNVFTRAGFSGQNSADSSVDIKGNGYLVQGNSGTVTLADAFQVHTVVSGWGLDNRFLANSLLGGVPGYLLYVASKPKPGGNVVSCNSNATGAARGLSNIACQ